VSGLNYAYGDAQALWDIDFAIDSGEIFSVIGSNGAGKSTIMKILSGLFRPGSGSIEFSGAPVTGKTADSMVALGISLVPEGRGLFSTLTVIENLELGAFTKKARSRMKETLEWVFELFPKIRGREKQLTGQMSGGEQQMVAIGRALMSRPKLLLLDEPSLGLAPLIVKDVFNIIRKLNMQGVTILLVEQNIHQALKVADHAMVLKNGRVTLTGSGRDMASDPEIQKAYMGVLA
jgi:branched-chain amino acid transport system ATP-binding protein